MANENVNGMGEFEALEALAVRLAAHQMAHTVGQHFAGLAASGAIEDWRIMERPEGPYLALSFKDVSAIVEAAMLAQLDSLKEAASIVAEDERHIV
jgi:hypothetical protein